MVGNNSIDGPVRDSVINLMAQKDKIESEIFEQHAILAADNVGMHDPLVDEEGYPRNDIDVYKIRHARHRIICLQNDFKIVMRAIEQGLQEAYKPNNWNGGPSSAPANASYTNGLGGDYSHANGNTNPDDKCFALIQFVNQGSPADVAGLLEKDELLQFGSINHRNFRDVSQIQEVVSHSMFQQIQVRVRRGRQVVSLTVVPRPWGQPGLLGCQIRPA